MFVSTYKKNICTYFLLIVKTILKVLPIDLLGESKKYYKDHREACRARRKFWGIKNRERIRKYNKEYKRKHKVT